jgi:hypothetical protein
MKTITIPKKFGYPTLDIHINGEKYTLESGKEISVADEIAEIIENAIALEPKIGVPRNKIAQLAENTLTAITAEDLAGISTIANCAFYSCTKLVSVTIPDNIKKIGENAFDWCTGLKTIYLPEVPPELASTKVFTDAKNDRIFYCKSQVSKEAYETAPNWSTLTETYSFVVEE